MNKLLENSFVISCNHLKLNFMRQCFENARLEFPIVFEAFNSPEESHFQIVKMAQSKNLPYVTIFEDDAIPDRYTYEKLVEIEKTLDQHWDEIGLISLGMYDYFGWRRRTKNGYKTYKLDDELVYDNKFYINRSSTRGCFAMFLKNDSYDDRLKSLTTPLKLLGYDYMKKRNLKYNWADRFAQEHFHKLCLMATTQPFIHIDIIKPNRIGIKHL